MSSESSMFDSAMEQVGSLMGKRPYSLYRPNYASADHTGTLIEAKKMYRIDTQAGRFMQPNIPGTFVYEVFGYRNVRPGDVLVSMASGEYPTVTVLSTGTLMPIIGLMTDKVGKITTAKTKTIYDNVRFQWAGPTFPGAGVNDALEETMQIPRRKIAMFRMDSNGGPAITKEMRIIEKSNDKSYIWRIRDVVTQFNITTLTVSEDTT